ncbi:MAG: excinuclease ABC subunit C, partial [Bacteroidia bacterium]
MSVSQAPEHIQTLLKVIPELPGVYQYFDKDEKLIYVGKAKSLKKRVSSYFAKDKYDSRKTAILVRKIRDIKFIVVESELDALLLENNLIKEYQPRYNVLLKDDKTFPWICIKKEPYPRIFPTRRIIKDGSQYFGPYANVKMMYTLLDLIRQLYPLRTCNLKLTQENIQAEKFKVCLEYHIGNCKGPCIGKQTEEDYETAIQHIKKIIKGNVREVREHLHNLMNEHAEKLQFEQAQILKEKLDTLVKFQSRSTVVSPIVDDADVFSIVSDVKSAYVNYMKVVEGAIVQAHTIELKKKLEEPDEE